MAHPVFSLDPRKCNGCRMCDLVCSLVRTGRPDLERSAIKTGARTQDGLFAPTVCLHCEDPQCARVCPTGALRKDPENGIVQVETAKCSGCLLCILACPYGGIYFDPQTGKVYKCDLCGGEPRCLPYCQPEALDYVNLSRPYAQLCSQEDLLSPGLSFCPGCGLEVSLRLALKVIGRNAILSVAPSCTAAVGVAGFQDATGSRVPVFFPLLTNTASMLTGVKRHFQRKGVEVHAVAIVGDGGTADVGFQSLSGAAERGENILYLCFNNEGYMNTGIQRSGTTPLGAWTTTTPVSRTVRGKTRRAKKVALLMAMHGIPYAATLNPAYPEDFFRKMEKAKEVKDGFIYLEIFAPCPVGWKFGAEKTIEVARLAVQTDFSPLWEAYHGNFRITFPVIHPRPVKDYLDTMGKYSHLRPEQADEIQIEVNKFKELLNKLAGSFQ